jgi:hypothetical protein
MAAAMPSLGSLSAFAILTSLLIAGQSRADAFDDCYHRIELACRHEVYASYGCTPEGQPAKQPKACKGRQEQSIVVRGNVVQCTAHCAAPRSTLDQCVSAATNHCAGLLDAPQGNPGP